MPEKDAGGKMLMAVARVECTAFESPVLIDSVDELLKFIDETLPMLGPDKPAGNRMVICIEHIDADVFEGLPSF